MTTLSIPNEAEMFHIRQFIETELDRNKTSHDSIRGITALIASYLLPTLSSLFSSLYHVGFSPGVSSFEEADVFLLGECHSDESTWRQLNGRFVTHLSQLHPLIIFVESEASMQQLTQALAEITRKEYQIGALGCNLRFYGWDAESLAMDEVQKLIVKCDVEMPKEIAELEKKIEACHLELEKLIPGYLKKDIHSLYSAMNDLSLRRRSLFNKRNKTKQSLLSNLSDLHQKREQIIFQLNKEIQKNFPYRTEAMVSTLKATKTLLTKYDDQTKFVFLAGANHIREAVSAPECCLDSLRAELKHHKAVRMLPCIPDPTQEN